MFRRRKEQRAVMQHAREDAVAYLTAIHIGDSRAAHAVYEETPSTEAFCAVLALTLIGQLEGLEEAGLLTVAGSLRDMGSFVAGMR